MRGSAEIGEHRLDGELRLAVGGAERSGRASRAGEAAGNAVVLVGGRGGIDPGLAERLRWARSGPGFAMLDGADDSVLKRPQTVLVIDRAQRPR